MVQVEVVGEGLGVARALYFVAATDEKRNEGKRSGNGGDEQFPGDAVRWGKVCNQQK